MITLTVNGISYQYPQVDDEDWGNQATLWASSVSDVLLCMRKPTLPTADAGVVRLGNGDAIEWRNFLNSANAKLYLDVDDKLYIKVGANPAIDLTANAAGNVTGPLSSTDNALARYDGTTGQVIQNSGAILDDSNNLSGLASVDATTLKQGGVAIASTFVTGPGSATDHGIVRYDGTGGKLVEDSSATVDDSGNLAAADISASGALAFGTISSTYANKVIDAYTRTTGTSVSNRGVAIAANLGSDTSVSGTVYTQVGTTATITTSGRPVIITMIPDSGLNASFLGVSTTSTETDAKAFFKIVRDSTDIYESTIRYFASTAIRLNINIAPASIMALDVVGAGTYAYKLMVKTNAASNIFAEVAFCKLIAYEL